MLGRDSRQDEDLKRKVGRTITVELLKIAKMREVKLAAQA